MLMLERKRHAQAVQRTFGTQAGAWYLMNLGVSVEGAVAMLALRRA